MGAGGLGSNNFLCHVQMFKIKIKTSESLAKLTTEATVSFSQRSKIDKIHNFKGLGLVIFDFLTSIKGFLPSFMS